MKKIRLPGFLIAFLAFFVFAVLHNFVYALFKFEEPVFFILALLSLPLSLVLLLIFLGKTFYKFFSKKS